jgi:hypothetical protein
MRPELYQRMLSDISTELGLAADLAYGSVSFTAHRFRIEDSEVSNTRFCSIFTLRCRHSASRSANSGSLAASHKRADSPQARARARRAVALRQSAKPHNVDLSFCYQLPVNHSR